MMISTWHRVVAIARRRQIAREVDDEIAFHMALRREQLQRDGTPPDEAARLARRQFGNVTRLREDTRDMWTFPSFESIVTDVTFALRALRRAPGFTVVAVLALAIGIGANTAIFSLVDAMLVRGLPYAEPDRLVMLIGNVQRATVERRGNSYPDYLDWRARATSFEDMAAFIGGARTIAGSGDPERVRIEGVSAAYFGVLGVTPALGRTFSPDEDAFGGRNDVAILSYGLWHQRFGGDPGVVGSSVRLDTTTYDVIGVMPAGFTGLTDQAAVWVPFVAALPQRLLESRGSRGFFAVARLAPGTAIAQAQSELDVISTQLEEENPRTNDARAVEVSPLSVETFGQIRPAVLALMAAVSFVLLIACANVANLLIGRAETRQREIAVRTALGAGWFRLLRQLVTESLVLSGLGAMAGLGLAWVSVRALVASSPIALPSFAAPALSLPVLAFTVGVALVCGLLLGIAPALHARIGRLSDVLKGSARGLSSASTHVRSVLVVAEVSLAVVLLVGAGLMIRTVQNLTAIDPGFETDSVLAMTVSVPRDDEAAADPDTPQSFVVPPRQLSERLAALPGVATASLVSDLPLSGGGNATFYTAEGDTTTDAQTQPRAYVHRVTPDFFDTMGIPILRGRTYTDAELRADSSAIIVSQGVVDRFWPDENPIGMRIKPARADSSRPWLTIIGVVPELKYRALPDNPTADPDLYFPYTDTGVQSIVLRTEVEPDAVIAIVRDAIQAVNPNIVVYNISSMADRVGAMTSQSRFTTWLMGLFAGAALLLAVIGIYGVMSYLVTLRMREFGIRVALGAGAREIMGSVMRHGARLIVIGLALGVGAALALSRLLESLLFGVSTVDPSAAVAVALLGVVACLACLLPALRATRVDPMAALRVD